MMGAEVDTEWCRGLSTDGRRGLGIHLQAGACERTHYHIATTFEAKESGVLVCWRKVLAFPAHSQHAPFLPSA